MALTRNVPSSNSSHSIATVGIVARVAFVRECILSRLGQEPGFSAVDFGSGACALEHARSSDPDLVVVDLPPAEACDLVGVLLSGVPGIRPIAVHRSTATEDLIRLAEAGYVGFVSTDSSFQDLLRELHGVMREEANCSPQLTGASLRSLQKRLPDGQARSQSHLEVLTAREQQVSLLLERRCSNKEIAAELGIEFGTVKNHVHNVLTKLGLHNRWEIPYLKAAKGALSSKLVAAPAKESGSTISEI